MNQPRKSTNEDQWGHLNAWKCTNTIGSIYPSNLPTLLGTITYPTLRNGKSSTQTCRLRWDGICDRSRSREETLLSIPGWAEFEIPLFWETLLTLLASILTVKNRKNGAGSTSWFLENPHGVALISIWWTYDLLPAHLRIKIEYLMVFASINN